MTLEQLRIFIAVAEREHVTQAAHDLHLTQSAVSAAIAALETRYDVKLFDRIGRGIALSKAGKLFLVEARAVIARAASAETLLHDITGLKRGALTLAASQTVANYWLPPVMARFREAHPGISLDLVIGNTEAVAGLVRDNAADLGFIEDTMEDPAFAITPVGIDEMVIVVSPHYHSRLLSPDDLRQFRWVFRERGSGTRAIFERALADKGIDPARLDILLELPSNEAVRSAVLDGAGAAALSRLAVTAALRAGTLIALKFPLPQRQFFALRLKERTATRAEEEFSKLAVAAGSRIRG
ncbi:MAG TPA: LysR family transcriptional regulator [Rhizomicrobium sp.]|nr:LysR family transcriptional regulator [Rhizomicrobium sp.]